MTYQRPAYEQVTIAHGENTVTLRPSLRAAVTLEARFGFAAMFRALEEGSFTIISEIILTASSPQDAAAFLAGIPGKPLSSFIGAARMPLAELVPMLMPASDPATRSSSAKSVPWADFYADLYEKATGWLAWTPEAAWNATPTEIDRAYQAYIERLVRTGVLVPNKEDLPFDPEQAARNEAEGLDPEFDRNALRALKAKIAGGA